MEDNLRAVVKPQYVDKIPQAIRGANRKVHALLEQQSQLGNKEEMIDVLGRNLGQGLWETG